MSVLTKKPKTRTDRVDAAESVAEAAVDIFVAAHDALADSAVALEAEAYGAQIQRNELLTAADALLHERDGIYAKAAALRVKADKIAALGLV